uniref:Uncharacterized protein n=1 Tax=Chromera velia CCMP2878 TaxID=1169474 RepID=A0A0G4FII9_9ALVE|eukprot:Cvel_17205.t1-p1 / transcript=Cvel_17205.t1 / gene=Cvel_17205 / organism=Chromera_velia_CCMP2878 / gene_product=hypothetical protein / transcript_product=hypothetical protein / location=Cvel_scaffold1360:34282-36847(+) / protein_length=267 / sequence_SO=supercontig / SO=protein_coding / is_pseudo=false
MTKYAKTGSPLPDAPGAFVSLRGDRQNEGKEGVAAFLEKRRMAKRSTDEDEGTESEGSVDLAKEEQSSGTTKEQQPSGTTTEGEDEGEEEDPPTPDSGQPKTDPKQPDEGQTMVAKNMADAKETVDLTKAQGQEAFNKLQGAVGGAMGGSGTISKKCCNNNDKATGPNGKQVPKATTGSCPSGAHNSPTELCLMDAAVNAGTVLPPCPRLCCCPKSEKNKDDKCRAQDNALMCDNTDGIVMKKADFWRCIDDNGDVRQDDKPDGGEG